MIDIARLYGIALVYYCHFIEILMYLQNATAARHYKFISSFHMPLFFLLSGFIAKERNLQISLGKYVKQRFASRIIPYIFFLIIFTVLTFFFAGTYIHLGVDLSNFKGYLGAEMRALFGFPVLNLPSWFLACLVSVELLHYVVFRHLKSNAMILISALSFYVVGYFLNLKFQFFHIDRISGWNYWFLHEAVVMYAFYLLGIFLRKRNFLVEKVSPALLVPGILISFFIVFFTYNLNTGPFRGNFDSVVIVLSAHGHFLLFPFTVIVGCLLILFLARLTPPSKMLIWMGQNALILFLLNGVFYHHINGIVAFLTAPHLAGSSLAVFVTGVVVTVLSLSLCVPFVFLFNKFIPQLVGKPKQNGPLLRNLL